MTTQNIYDITDLWDDAGTTFTSLKINTTDTASAAGSLLMDLQVGGSSKVRVTKNGLITIGTTSGGASLGSLRNGAPMLYTQGTAVAEFYGNGINLPVTSGLSWSASSSPTDAGTDLIVLRDATNTLALRNSTNPQAFRVYGSYTDVSNFTRLALGHNGTSAFISEQIAGTGAAGGIAVSAASLSGSQATSLLAMVQTWDTTGTPTALKLDVTDTASNGSSLLMDLRVGGTSRFSIAKNGDFRSNGNARVATTMVVGQLLRWGNLSPTAGEVTIDGRTSSVASFSNYNQTSGSGIEFIEMTAPSAPAANRVRIYAEDDGSGKTRLMALFATGAAQQIAIEP